MSTKYVLTSPEDVYEEPIVVPRNTDYPIIVYGREDDEDCDPSNDPPFDFTGSSPKLEVFSHHSDDAPILTFPAADWTITQNQEGADAGVNNIIRTTLDYDTLIADLDLILEYWYRIHVTDAAGLPYVMQRGPFTLDDK